MCESNTRIRLDLLLHVPTMIRASSMACMQIFTSDLKWVAAWILCGHPSQDRNPVHLHETRGITNAQCDGFCLSTRLTTESLMMATSSPQQQPPYRPSPVVYVWMSPPNLITNRHIHAALLNSSDHVFKKRNETAVLAPQAHRVVGPNHDELIIWPWAELHGPLS